MPEVTRPGERRAHLARVAGRLTAALAEGPADLVVLPELTATGYSKAAFERLGELAEEPQGESAAILGEVAERHGVHLVFGIPRAGAEGVHITQVVLGPGGEVLGHYDKLHLAQYGASREKDHFRPGRHLFVFEAAGIKVAPIICYDIRFPELTRRLCLEQGADLILHSAAFFRDESFASWHSFVTTRAMENQVYVLSLNWAGEDYGASIFCPPWADEKTPPAVLGNEETFARFQVDPARLAEVRRGYGLREDRLDYAALEVGSGGD
jgi:nitrilase